jgi:hypothetical protein
MAINIQNIIAALEAKVAAATSATETQELIVIIKSIKAAGQQTIVTYADVPNLPTASADNAGNLGYVAAVGKIYYSNGTTWTEVGSGGSGGGGGTAYDQSLNTTDDVVFNSALVGDVSIIGNEISGVDAYGNPDTLVVNNALQVAFSAETLIDYELISDPNYNNDIGYFNYQMGYPRLEILNTQFQNNSAVQYITSKQQGDYIYFSFNTNYGNTTGYGILQSVAGGSVSYVDFSDVVYTSGQSLFGQSVTLLSGSKLVSKEMSETIALSVTESGVNVDGTFTVNGQPVGGGGSLVATDALIGDVSIIGNEISGTDAYGNADTLALNTPVDFKATKTVGSEATIAVVGENITPALDFSTYAQYVSITVYNSQSAIQQLTAIPAGTLVTTALAFNSSTYENQRFRFVVQSSITNNGNPYDPSAVTDVRFTVVPGTLELSNDNGITWNSQGYDNQQRQFGGAGALIYGSTTTVENTVLSVTETGINSSTDLAVIIDTTNTVTNTVTGFSGPVRWGYDNVNPSNPVSYLITNNDLSSNFKAGMTITAWLDSAGQRGSQVTFTLSSDMAYSMNRGGYVSNTVENNPYGTTVDLYPEIITSVTTGAVVDYSFSTEGAFTTPMLLADSALIGAVSIVDNEIAVEDSYGLPGTLNVSASEVVVKSNLDFTIDSRTSVTETVTDPTNMNQFTVRSAMMGSPQFTYSPNEGSSWANASKFITGTIVSLTDSMSGTKVVRLTSDMTYDNMDNRWEAGYTQISGSTNSMSDFRSFSVIVTNESGAVANYGFDDQGVLSTKSLLVDGVSPVFLVANQDGSKSVNVDSTEVTTYAGDNMGSDPTKVYWSYAQWSTSMGGYGANTIRINGTNQKTVDVISALVAGDKITFGRYDMANQGVLYTTATVASYNYDAMNNDHFITTVELNSNAGSGIDFSSSYGLSVESPVVRDYSFDVDGAFTTPSIIAETALIGDVSIVANTVSATNSYGNPDTLVVDGGLDVKTQSSITTDYFYGSPPAPGQWDGDISWNGTTLSWNNPSGDTLTLINSLNVGDTITFTDTMYYQLRTITLTSTITYDMMDMRYEATVAENNSTGMSISALTTSPLTVTALITKTSSFDSTGLNVEGILTVNGQPIGGPTTTITSVNMAPINSDEAVASYAYGNATVFKTGSKVRVLLDVYYNSLWTSTDATWTTPIITLPYTVVSGSFKTTLLNIDNPDNSVQYGLYTGTNFSGALFTITKKFDTTTMPPTYVDVSTADYSDQSLWRNKRHVIEINYETTQ